MFVVTGKEMAAIDRAAIDEWGIPELVLMENAGLRVVEEIQRSFSQLKDKKVVIIAGKGNNGGDGLVIARHLYNLGVDVKIFFFGKKEYRGASLVNYKIAQKLPIKWHNLDNENSLHLLKLTLHYTDIIVDSLFGTGFRGAAQGIAAKIIQIINDSNTFKVAVDIPSGLDADTGRISGPCIKADLTVTFALPKLGLVIQPGCENAGKVIVRDISIPNNLLNSHNGDKILITKNMVRENLPKRKEESHKGNYGHLLIVGGSVGMMGAVHLAAQGAFVLGAGLTTAAVPKDIQPVLAGGFPELITLPLTQTAQGTLGFISGPEIANILAGKSAVVFGPGIGRNNELNSLLKWLLGQLEIPIIIDADGLNALAEDLQILKERKCHVILTPHPGEMGRLLQKTTGEVQENRIVASQELALKYQVWVVLKGNKTIIATPEGKIYINPTGSPSLATAGTGDILAGIIGALIGQVSDITKAIYTGVFIHGLAGEYVAENIGEISSKATDVVGAIPIIIKEEFGNV